MKPSNEDMAEFIQPLAKLGQQMTQFTGEIGMKALSNADEVGAAAVDYLRVTGHLVFGLFLGSHGAKWLCKKWPTATETRSTKRNCKRHGFILQSCCLRPPV
jgi:hypothetical protein